jgi:hypothetical protein
VGAGIIDSESLTPVFKKVLDERFRHIDIAWSGDGRRAAFLMFPSQYGRKTEDESRLQIGVWNSETGMEEEPLRLAAAYDVRAPIVLNSDLTRLAAVGTTE